MKLLVTCCLVAAVIALPHHGEAGDHGSSTPPPKGGKSLAGSSSGSNFQESIGKQQNQFSDYDSSFTDQTNTVGDSSFDYNTQNAAQPQEASSFSDSAFTVVSASNPSNVPSSPANAGAQSFLPTGGAQAASQFPFNFFFDDDNDELFRSRRNPYMSGEFGLFSPTQYTALDLTQVDFKSADNSGFQKYLQMADNSGEREVYQLVGVAPSAAMQGGSVSTRSGTGSMPVYKEMDEEDFYFSQLNPTANSRMGQVASFYAANNQPLHMAARATMSGNQMVLILSD